MQTGVPCVVSTQVVARDEPYLVLVLNHIELITITTMNE